MPGMPAPHGQTEPLDQSFALRMTEGESSHIRRRAHEWSTSINSSLRRLIQADMAPPRDPRGAAVAAIEAHTRECPLCTEATMNPQCPRGRILKAAYDATVSPPAAPRPARPVTRRRALKDPAGLGLPPVEPVAGQVPLPEGDSTT